MNATNIAGAKQNSLSHFSFGSALLEFMAGKLGAPGCWPDETHPGGSRHADLRALNRWENEGGRTLSPLALHDARPSPN
jgi:hypothetical protein